MSRSDRLATVTEAITGQTEKVMQPTTILALIEQSLEQFSSIQEAQIDAWTDELNKIFRLNALYMPPEEYFVVQDVGGKPEEESVLREDYAMDMQVAPVADPRLATEQQRLAKAEAEYQFALNNQLIMNNKHAFWAISRTYLEALQSENIDEKLPEPEEEPEKQRVDNPEEENFTALLPVPDIPTVFPDQDHANHIQSHQVFLSEYSGNITPEGKKGMDAHNQTHIAMLYGERTGILDQMLEESQTAALENGTMQ